MTEPSTAHPTTRAVIAGIRAAERADGRLPDVTAEALGEIFPFEGDMRVKPVDAPVVPEPPRHGEDPTSCAACARPDEGYLWTDERWRLTAPREGSVLPVMVLLEPRAHLDLGDLDDRSAAELGRLTVLLERAIRSVGGVGRVHVNRWGDGGAHLHVWFLARPEGMLQLRGSALPTWLDVLPPLDPALVRANETAVARALVTTYGGTAHV